MVALIRLMTSAATAARATVAQPRRPRFAWDMRGFLSGSVSVGVSDVLWGCGGIRGCADEETRRGRGVRSQTAETY
ncbi:hypothetical protein GCM10027160_03890 [Streptomyces calidiresistens]